MEAYRQNCPYLYRGKVEDNNDPKNLGRCRVRVPSIHGELEYKVSILPWARPIAFAPVDSERGSVSIPKEGDIVWVLFEGADRNYPVYFGGTYGEGDIDIDKDKIILYMEDGNAIEYDRTNKAYSIYAEGNGIRIDSSGVHISGTVLYDGSDWIPGGDLDIDSSSAMSEEELQEILDNIDAQEETFLYYVILVKALMAAKGVTYNQSGYVNLDIKGKSKKVRTDCSGLVSAMVSAYTGNDILMSSYGYVGASSLAGFTKVTGSDLKAGDICARNGHVEVYAYRKDGVDYVYSGGSTKSLNSAGPTRKGTGSYSAVWRPNK